ncbi:hypothetical protein [Reinekea sp. G2M2-21]|uniref:hypothetical protein n=1 Tax=Reinekea sp. G2M2-21 TaxID=2788942 RepID=UPI0018A9FD2C|nr:hypothetical protein [Reinekea sp. G2M2-21]
MSDPFQVIPLSGFDLANASSLRRKHVRNESRRNEHYLARYDDTTLFYDCFYNPQKRCYTFTAPRFLNLWPEFKQAVQVNGSRFRGRLKRYTWQRCEQVEVYAPANAELSLRSEHLNGVIPVRDSHRDLFSAMNCALAISKDNQLSWIRDWAQFHVRAHGLEAVCIIDNASTEYTASDVLETLRSVSELKAAVVLSAPFPYGPVDSSKKLEVSPRFLQTSMFNLIKQDLFADARAILSVDIDELVMPNKSVSVFDAAVAARLGAVSFRELRVFPEANEERAYNHRAHTQVRAGRKLGNTKWCVAGHGFMNRFGWAVHRFGGAFFPFTETQDFTYLHCHATSTSWKKNRYGQVENLMVDGAVQNALTQYLKQGE